MEHDPDIEVEGSDNPYDNVVTFGDKKLGEVFPYTPPPLSPREQIAARELDEDAILMLEELLERFKSGDAHGLACCAGQFDDRGNFIDAAIILSDVACSYPLAFIGAVEDLKMAVVQERLVSAGEGQAVPELQIYEDED